MQTLVDDASIIVSEGTACLVITAGDPAYGPVRKYLLDERGDDFDKVIEIVTKHSRSVAAQFGPSGIRIDAIAPGFIKPIVRRDSEGNEK
jgi:hypothetical protein